MSDEGSSPKKRTALGADSSSTQELPAVDFSTFILSLGHSVLMNLGAVTDTDSVKSPLDLVMAKQTIGLIALLAEKTSGNLSGEEERLVEQLLYDLRERYSLVNSGK